jgi:hypothetical protein
MKNPFASIFGRKASTNSVPAAPDKPPLVEAPRKDDLRVLASQVMHAEELSRAAGGVERLVGELHELRSIQKVLDSKHVEPEATDSLQALGVAFGRVFIKNNEGYDWCMVQDEHGRDPAIRYQETSIRVFPKTMISKRVEDGVEVDVEALYEGLQEQLESIRREIDADA